MKFCPINKEPCHHRKCVHITDIKQDMVIETSLCHVCSKEFYDSKDIKEIPIGAVTKEVEDFMEVLHSAINEKHKKPKTTPCPVCHCTILDIAEKQRIGCANCYSHFQSQILSVIKSTQEATEHTGKIPDNWKKQQMSQLDILDKISLLKQRQTDFIKKEDYESAGELQEEINELEDRVQE